MWPEIVEAARQESRFLGEALAACKVIRAYPPTVAVQLPVEQAVLSAPIERGRQRIEQLLSARLGRPAMLQLEQGQTDPQAERPRRMTDAAMRTERLKSLRGTDPALDVAVDELDLEIVEERPPGGR